MSADITSYTDLIPSEHNSKPNFMAVLAAIVQPVADISAVIESLPTVFDIDYAVGKQLDDVGLWIGQSRNLKVPLTGVYFALDDAIVGLDQGYLQGPYDPTSGLVSLNDDSYRQLLRAKIAANQWDGTIPSAYAFLAPVFPNNTIIIQDNGDMSMYVGTIGPALDAVTTSLLENGYLSVKPAGVSISGFVTSSVSGDPIFGLDADTTSIGGLDHGAMATITGGY